MDVIQKNPKLWMLVIYLFLVAAFLYFKPGVAFGMEGRIRPFGTTDQDTTVFPLWWWIFIFAVVSYLSVVWLLDFKM